MSRSLFCLFILFIAFALCSCKGQKPKGDIIAWVNNEPIRFDEFVSYLKLQGNGKENEPIPYSSKLSLLYQLIEEKLLIQEAKRIGLDVSKEELENTVQTIRRGYLQDDFERYLVEHMIDYKEWEEQLKKNLIMEKLNEQVIKERVEVSQKDIVEYYNAHMDEFKTPVQLKLRQILVANKEDALNIQNRILKGEDFSKVASEYLTSPEANQSFELGWLVPGSMPRSVEEKIFSLPKGSVSRVIESPFGYHIFFIEDKKEAGELELDEVKDKIKHHLERVFGERFYQEWRKQLWSRTSLKINYFLL